MGQRPSDEVRAELRDAISKDRKTLGEVFPLLDSGLSDSEIAQKLGRATPGFVSNNRTHVRAILDGSVPRGPTMAGQTAGAVRRVESTPGLSEGARNHLRSVLDELDRAAADQAPREHRPSPSASPPRRTTSRATNLRGQVDATVRQRTEQLIQRIRTETGVEADDYYRACSAAFALDGVARLVAAQAASRTTRALHNAARLDLSIEQAVLDWAHDLPVTDDLVESARGRLGYWRSE